MPRAHRILSAEGFLLHGAGLYPCGTISEATLSESPGKAVKNIVTSNDR